MSLQLEKLQNTLVRKNSSSLCQYYYLYESHLSECKVIIPQVIKILHPHSCRQIIIIASEVKIQEVINIKILQMRNDPCSCKCNLCNNCLRSVEKNNFRTSAGFEPKILLYWYREVTGSNSFEVLNFFFWLLTQLHKLRSQLQGSSLIWFHFHSSLLCFISYSFVIKILVIIKWLVHDLVPVIPSLVKVVTNTRPCSKPRRKNFEWREGRPGGWVLYLTDMWLATICVSTSFCATACSLNVLSFKSLQQPLALFLQKNLLSDI